MSTVRSRGQLAQSERQMKIIKYIQANGSVNTTDLVSLFHISLQAALKELSQMAGKELIQMEGIRRGDNYILT